MTTDNTPQEAPSTGTPAVQDAGQQLLDQLDADGAPLPILDPIAYRRGCVVVDIALHAPAGLWIRIGLYDHPAQGPAYTVEDLPDIEILARDDRAAADIRDALPWRNPPVTRREVWSESGRTHVITRGVLWDTRISIVGLEPDGGAA